MSNLNNTAKAVLVGLLTIAPFAATANAGRALGPGSVTQVAAGGQTIFYYETIRGGEVTNIRLSGDGDSDLDLHVFDLSGNAVCFDNGPSDEAAVWVKTDQTVTIRIEVRNLGAMPNRYTMSLD